jgi:predicted DNA-binding protein (UPF0251 family)
VGRQPLGRRVCFMPEVTYFKPSGIPLAQIEEITLAVEEAEALRLKDIEGLEQEECAQRMNVSRTTFARVLAAARRKTADALLNGKAIRIEGGNFEMTVRRYRCINGHRWDVPSEEAATGPVPSCPACDNPAVTPVTPWKPVQGRGRRGRQYRGGRGKW